MTRVICPECGADEYVTKAGHELLRQANDRFRRSNTAQAIEIARLKLDVMELQDRDNNRDRKVRNQARVIVRLENRLRALGKRPYEQDGNLALLPNDLKIVGEFINGRDRDETVMLALVNIQHTMARLLGEPT